MVTWEVEQFRDGKGVSVLNAKEPVERERERELKEGRQ